jgi:hypothetical protein
MLVLAMEFSRSDRAGDPIGHHGQRERANAPAHEGRGRSAPSQRNRGSLTLELRGSRGVETRPCPLSLTRTPTGKWSTKSPGNGMSPVC